MSQTKYRNLLILLLTLVCGLVDAIGYLGIGHVFTANMTGNIVLLGFSIGHAEGFYFQRPMFALLGFIVGAAIATVFVSRNQEKTVWPPQATIALTVEIFVLIAFAIVSGISNSDPVLYAMIVLLSVAMGIQTTTARRIGVAGLTTTVLTSTTANIIEDVTKATLNVLRKRRAQQPDANAEDAAKKKKLLSDTLLRVTAILMYCLGAVIGALAEPRVQFSLVWLPIAMVVGIVFISVFKFGLGNVRNQNQQQNVSS